MLKKPRWFGYLNNLVVQRVAALLLGVVILMYTVYHVASLFGEEISTVASGVMTETKVVDGKGYIFRDEVVNALKMHSAKNGIVVAASNSGKIKTFAMMTGLSLMFFYNLPFELINIRVDEFLIYFATVMAVVSGVEYYFAIMRKTKLSK